MLSDIEIAQSATPQRIIPLAAEKLGIPDEILEPHGHFIAKVDLAYLDQLPETVVLIEHAAETCEWAASRGELGIITNGIQSVQERRIRASGLAPYIHFVAISEACGFAKPDRRFFEYGVKMARRFAPERTLMIGDKLETDILGARDFGIDACWYNPLGPAAPTVPGLVPTREIRQLSELRPWLEA